MVSFISKIQAKEARKAHSALVYRPPAPPRPRPSPFIATDHEAIALRAMIVLGPLMPVAGTPNPPIPMLRQRQHDNCYLCSRPLGKRSGTMGDASTRDHVFPQCAGATGNRNILLAHACCNGRKGNRFPRPCELIFLAAVYAL